MKTQTTPAVVSPSSAPVPARGCILGLDLGDRKHHVCVLNAQGEILHEGSLLNTRPALAQLLTVYPGATVALEAGTHSPWISRFLSEHGASVLVANPRKLHAISRHERKCDRRDAQMLARLARVDPALLAPIAHGTAQAQHDLLGLKLRDALVRTRTGYLSVVRARLRQHGWRGPTGSAEGFIRRVLALGLPGRLLSELAPLLAVMRQVNQQVAYSDQRIAAIARADARVERLQRSSAGDRGLRGPGR